MSLTESKVKRSISGWSLFCQEWKDKPKPKPVRELWKEADKERYNKLAQKMNESNPVKTKSKIIDSELVDRANARVLFVFETGKTVVDWEHIDQKERDIFINKARAAKLVLN